MTSPVRRPTATMWAVAALVALEGLQGYGVSLLTPEIATTLRVGVVSVVSARLLGLLVNALVPLIASRFVVASHRLTYWLGWLAPVGVGVALALTGRVHTSGALVGLLCLGAFFSGIGAAHRAPQVVAAGGVRGDVRTLFGIHAAVLLSQLLLAVGIAVGALSSWQRAVEVTGVVAVAIASVIGASMRRAAAVPDATTDAEQHLRWRELSRAWRATPSLVGVAIALLGAARACHTLRRRPRDLSARSLAPRP